MGDEEPEPMDESYSIDVMAECDSGYDSRDIRIAKMNDVMPCMTFDSNATMTDILKSSSYIPCLLDLNFDLSFTSL